MTDLAADFLSLPPEYQTVIRLAQERHSIQITPLQALAGGWSGAMVYLVSVLSASPQRIEHLVLKLDRKGEHATADETQRHAAAARLAPPEFAAQHLARLAFERVEAEGALAIFYAVAGQSLHRYRTLAAYERQDQIETIFAATYENVLSGWNAARTFKQAVPPTALLEQWLAFRLKPGNHIEKFMQGVLNFSPDLSGFLIQGGIFPNPLAYARHPEWWGAARPMDAAFGLQHGDLNTGNILVKFAPDEQTLAGYYLIDFALFREQMPLLLDLRYLEMSYLVLRQAHSAPARLIDLIVRLGEADRLEPQRLPVDVAGVGALIGSARQVFDRWVEANHPSLHDDLWGQYWLAGVAAGLAYCHKPALGPAERLTGLVYAAANMKRYAELFHVPTPGEGRQLYTDLAHLGQTGPSGASSPAGGSPLSATPNNLPTQLTQFIGRESELAALKGLLAIAHNRLVTLVAPGGMGKTRLALEAVDTGCGT